MSSSRFNISSTGGTGTQVVSVSTAGRNDGVYFKEANVNITSGNKTARVWLRQYSMPVIEANSETYVPYEGGNIEITVRTQYDFWFNYLPTNTLIYDLDAMEYVTIDEEHPYEAGELNLRLEIGQNDESETTVDPFFLVFRRIDGTIDRKGLTRIYIERQGEDDEGFY